MSTALIPKTWETVFIFCGVAPTQLHFFHIFSRFLFSVTACWIKDWVCLKIYYSWVTLLESVRNIGNRLYWVWILRRAFWCRLFVSFSVGQNWSFFMSQQNLDLVNLTVTLVVLYFINRSTFQDYYSLVWFMSICAIVLFTRFVRFCLQLFKFWITETINHSKPI